MNKRFFSSKVKIWKSTDNAKKVNLYEANKRRLNFLPSIFVIFFLLLFVALCLYIYKPFDINASEILKTGKFENSLDLVRNRQLNSYSTVENNTILPSKELSAKYIKINNQQSDICFLKLEMYNPGETLPLIQKSSQGWWIPDSCSVETLKAVQVVRLQEQELDSLKKQVLVQNLQVLDESKKIYAIVYNQDDLPTIYNFNLFAKSLMSSIYLDEEKPIAAIATDTKRIAEDTFYLEGGCNNYTNNSCMLWKTNNFDGRTQLLKENIADTAKGQVNEIKAGFALRFAKIQDYDNALSMILVDEKTTNFRLLRIDMNTLKIIEFEDIKPGQSGYSEYYR